MADYSNHHKHIGSKGGTVRAVRRTNEDGRKAAAAEGRMRRFYEQVPEDITDPVERARLAHLAMRAHMVEMARRSAQSRSKPKATDEAA